MTKDAISSAKQYRLAGLCAIASGVIGLVAVAALITYLIFREDSYDLGNLAQKFHDVGVILQFGLLIPSAYSFYNLSQHLLHRFSQLALNIGVYSLSLTSLFLLLSLPKVTSDIIYMLPQGVFGVWLIFINFRLKALFSPVLRWFGIIVGIGLASVGIFFIAYTLLVSTMPLWIPTASIEEQSKIPISPTNIFLHTWFLNTGSLLGVLTLPFWSIFLGIALTGMTKTEAGLQN